MEWNGLLCTNIHRKAFKNSFYFFSCIYTHFFYSSVCLPRCQCVVEFWRLNNNNNLGTFSIIYFKYVCLYSKCAKCDEKKIPLQERKTAKMKKKVPIHIFFFFRFAYIYMFIYPKKYGKQLMT